MLDGALIGSYQRWSRGRAVGTSRGSTKEKKKLYPIRTIFETQTRGRGVIHKLRNKKLRTTYIVFSSILRLYRNPTPLICFPLRSGGECELKLVKDKKHHTLASHI